MSSSSPPNIIKSQKENEEPPSSPLTAENLAKAASSPPEKKKIGIKRTSQPNPIVEKEKEKDASPPVENQQEGDNNNNKEQLNQEKSQKLIKISSTTTTKDPAAPAAGQDDETEPEFELEKSKNRPALFGPVGVDETVVERYVLSEMGAVSELDDALEKTKQILETSLYQCARHSLYHIAQNREELQRQQRDFDLEKLRQEFETKRMSQKEEELRKREENLQRREEVMVKREEQLMSRDRALERIQVFAHEDLRRQRLISIANVELSEIVLEHVRRVEITAANDAPQQFFLSNVSKYLQGYNENLKQLAHSPKLDKNEEEILSPTTTTTTTNEEKQNEEQQQNHHQPSAEELIVQKNIVPLPRPPLHSAQPHQLRSIPPRALNFSSSSNSSSSSPAAILLRSQKQRIFFTLVDSIPSFYYKVKRDFGLDVCPLHIQGGRAMHTVREAPILDKHGGLIQQQQYQVDKKDFQFNVISSAFNPFATTAASTTVGQGFFNVELFEPRILKSFLLLGDPLASKTNRHMLLNMHMTNGGSNVVDSSSPLSSPSSGSPLKNRENNNNENNNERMKKLEQEALKSFMSPSIEFVYFSPQQQQQHQQNQYNNKTSLLSSSPGRDYSRVLEDCVVLVAATSTNNNNNNSSQSQDQQTSNNNNSSSIPFSRPQSAPTARNNNNNGGSKFLFAGRNVEQPSSITVHTILARVPLSSFVESSNNNNNNNGDNQQQQKQGEVVGTSSTNNNNKSTSFTAHVDLRAKNLIVKKQVPKNKWRVFGPEQSDEEEKAARIASALVHSGQAESDEPIPLYSASASFDEELSKNKSQAKSAVLNDDAKFFVGVMLTSPCAAVEFVKMGEVIVENGDVAAEKKRQYQQVEEEL